MTLRRAVVLCAFPLAVMGQPVDSMAVPDKLLFHAETVFSPQALAGSALYAGFLQTDNSPREWGQGAGAYGKRFASTVATTAIHGALAFGLDSTLHQDPRYYRAGGSGFWRRSAHALRETMLTHTDSGGETLSTWRIGSAYGSAFLSNLWYPDRLNNARLGFIQGSATLGFDLIGSLGKEFWPDVKRKVLHRP